MRIPLRCWPVFLLCAVGAMCASASCASTQTLARTFGDDAAGAGTVGETPPASAPGDEAGALAMPGASSVAAQAASADDAGGSDDATDGGDAGARAVDGGVDPAIDAPPMPPFDPGEGGLCAGPVAPGDLRIDEMMIESVAGSGDHGEWLEVESRLGCALDLRGLYGDAPSGSSVRSFAIGDDLWIPAFGRLVVADSTSAAINHRLPGPLVAWFGQPGDVLRNKGDTITLRMNGVVIDSVTYPSMALIVGTSLAFPGDCPPDRRSDWTAWQPSVASWFPGFFGTPNAPNIDVHCP